MILPGPNVINLLRGRLSDDSASKESFFLRVSDNASEAFVQLYSGLLQTNLINSVNGKNLSVDLNDSRYDTVQKLIQYLNAQKGYVAQASVFIDQDFPSSELELLTTDVDLTEGPVSFYHRRFSNKELIDILDMSARAHNLNYTYQTIPEAEVQLVLEMAHSKALLRLANDTVKRAGMDIDSAGLLKLSQSYADSYQEILTRQRRAVPVPSINDSEIGEGDIVSGHIYRASQKTGRMTHRLNTNPPERPVLFEPKDLEVGDDYVVLKWLKPGDSDITHVSLWRDTNPNVQGVSELVQPLFTSRSVFSGNSRYYSMYGGLFDVRAETHCTYIDGLDNQNGDVWPLEPLTTYYYKMYVSNANGFSVDSNVITCKTKAPRARFSVVDAVPKLTPTTGSLAGGTALVIRGTHLHVGMKVWVGDKLATDLVIVNATTLTCVTPTVFNVLFKDKPLSVVLQSNTGLKDIMVNGWTYL